MRSPHSGLVPSYVASGGSSVPKLCGLPVVLEDLVAVQVVHGTCRVPARRRPVRDGRAGAGVGAEDALHAAQAGRQAVDVVAAAVDVEGGAAGGRLAEPLVERLRAVVAGADGDRLAVEERGHVVGVDASAG